MSSSKTVLKISGPSLARIISELVLAQTVQDSAKVVISRLLARNCCSVAVVVSALDAGQVENSSSHGCYHFGTRRLNWNT